MESLFAIIIYFLEMIKYQFVYRLFYHAKLKNNILFPLLGCIFVILPACAPLPFYKKYVLIVFCTLVCLFLQLNDIIRIRLRQLLVLFFFASCMDEINTLFIQSTSFYRLLVPKMSGLSYVSAGQKSPFRGGKKTPIQGD